MSRITGNDALGLFEAYQAVYNPQELTEEQIWEEVENWVNSLLEEGHDLTGYTWEDMYEAYVKEARAEGVKPYKPQPLRPLPQAKPLSGEKNPDPTSGYGEDKKFNKPDDRIKNPGTQVPPIKKGGYGRIFKNIPHGIGAHATRTISRNTTVTGGDPGAPTSQKIAGKQTVSREIIRRPQAEQVDVYDLILSHLLDEGYANSVDAAEKIMVNMSEEWRESIVEDIRGAITYNPNTPIGRLKRRIKGSTPEKREARTRDYQGNKSDTAERFGGSQRAPYDDNRGDIPALRGK